MDGKIRRNMYKHSEKLKVDKGNGQHKIKFEAPKSKRIGKKIKKRRKH